MATIKRFEDLDCWKASRALARHVYKLCDEGRLSKDFDPRSQFRRAAASTMNNIAEGFGRYSNKEFIRFLEYSQSSSRELKSMSYLLRDLEYVSDSGLDELEKLIEDHLNLIMGFIRYLSRSTSKHSNSKTST